jgi:hypothetical protein
MPLQLDPCGSVFVVFRPTARTEDPITSLSFEGKLIAADATVEPNTSIVVGAVTAENGKVALTVRRAGDYSATTASGRKLSASAGRIPEPMLIAGRWQIQFPTNRGAPPSTTLDQLASWTEAKEDGIKYFSGTATYKKTVTLSRDQLQSGIRLFLDLGEVKNLAEVSLNGRDLGMLWKPPYRIEVTDAAKVGENQLEIKVTNLWPNRLIGDQHLPLSEQITWTTYNPYHADSPLLSSGLIGPVSIRAAQQIAFAP